MDSLTQQIVPLDAADPDAMAAWYAAYESAALFERALATPLKLEEKRAKLLGSGTGERVLGFLGYADGTVVTAGELWLPLKDNLHLAGIEVSTTPERRNRGHGGRMLEHLVELARKHGRRTVTAAVATPYAGAPDGRGHPDVDFALHRGFTFALGDILRVLDLPADEGRLKQLADQASPHHADFRLRRFTGPVPDDIIDDFGRLVGAVVTEAPTGEFELEPEVYDRDRIRADEKVFQAAGRTKYTTVAIAADGTAAGYTEIAVPRHDPGRAFQWGTLVLREHRGHRLGLAMKVHNQLWLQRERPDLRQVITFNAEVNAPMVAVNDLLGFRPVERLGEFQRQLD